MSRVQDVPVSVECAFMQEMAPSNLGRVFGRILLVRVSEDALVDRDRQHVDADKLDLIGRTEDTEDRAFEC